MPATEPQPLPDIAVGRHPDFGVVAANPKHLAASAWMLKGFGFHPVPGHPDLYALADQERDGQGRATRTVALLRKANYHVDADAAFEPSPAPDSAAGDRPVRTAPVPIAPDVAFAEHPQLGLVAATTDGVPLARQLLGEHGWQPHPRLDIYLLPPATEREDGLGAVARTTVAMNRAGLQVAVQPGLATDVTQRRTPGTAPARPEQGQHSATRTFPVVSAAALAASPARAGLPGKPAVPTPATPPPTSQTDPRVASSRTR
jgi:hypothetical protein